jgi:hypothetical protein
MGFMGGERSYANKDEIRNIHALSLCCVGSACRYVLRAEGRHIQLI